MKTNEFITDIFGNRIEVTDLKAAIKQTNMFVDMSKEVNYKFEENGKEVTFLEFNEHQLKELNKLK